MVRIVGSLLLVIACAHAGLVTGAEESPTTAYTVEIAAEGLSAERNEEFRLKAGQALKIVDFTGTAVFEPVPRKKSVNAWLRAAETNNDIFDPAKENSLNAIAYLYKDGKCDFNQTVEYKEIFKRLDAYKTPLWDPQTKPVQTIEASAPGTKVVYTFTNLPASNLEGSVTFCVRFGATKKAGSSATSSPGRMRSGTQMSQGQEGQKQYLNIIIHSASDNLVVKLASIAALALGTFFKGLCF